jgi:hypothetical protein
MSIFLLCQREHQKEKQLLRKRVSFILFNIIKLELNFIFFSLKKLIVNLRDMYQNMKEYVV